MLDYLVMEATRRSSTQSKTSQKKTTFFLTSNEGSKEPSNESKQLGEQGNSRRRFASVAKKVLLANRAFPPMRKLSRGNIGLTGISIPIPQDAVVGKLAPAVSVASNSVEESASMYAAENVITMENTYKMEPDNLFLTERARGIIREVLEAHLKGKSYVAEEGKKLSFEISEEIKRKVKAETRIKRYKFVCVVWIGQVLGQGVHITSRCLWNQHFDNFAQESYKNDRLFAQASVFAVFVE